MVLLKIGYSSFAFSSVEDAVNCFKLLSKAAHVQVRYDSDSHDQMVVKDRPDELSAQNYPNVMRVVSGDEYEKHQAGIKARKEAEVIEAGGEVEEEKDE